ncbi:hypothetical protein DPEC_G00072870 [Dallia pectoralis]|uniref:Uncharacterized protein n=1 Tax=Dallia pectoralis TaxID=75939 RepID=A0ACC2H2S3_DALPE|nr:hypothetical protein DPEC_G00072870 [Dallia pectoralis]
MVAFVTRNPDSTKLAGHGRGPAAAELAAHRRLKLAPLALSSTSLSVGCPIGNLLFSLESLFGCLVFCRVVPHSS